jgi:hypothetical protein
MNRGVDDVAAARGRNAQAMVGADSGDTDFWPSGSRGAVFVWSMYLAFGPAATSASTIRSRRSQPDRDTGEYLQIAVGSRVDRRAARELALAPLVLRQG